MYEIPKHLHSKKCKHFFKFDKKTQAIGVVIALTAGVAIVFFGSIAYLYSVFSARREKRREIVADINSKMTVIRTAGADYKASSKIRIETVERIYALLERFKELNKSLKGYEEKFSGCRELESQRKQVFANFSQLDELFQKYYFEEYSPEIKTKEEFKSYLDPDEIASFIEVKARRDMHTEKLNEYFQNFLLRENDLLGIKVTYERIMLMVSPSK